MSAPCGRGISAWVRSQAAAIAFFIISISSSEYKAACIRQAASMGIRVRFRSQDIVLHLLHETRGLLSDCFMGTAKVLNLRVPVTGCLMLLRDRW